MRHTAILLTTALSLMWAGSSLAAEQTGAPAAVVENQAQTPAVEATQPVEVGNEFCLISGEKVGQMGPVVKEEYKGKIYNFCCNMCLKDFHKDPEKYIKALEEKMKASDQEGNSKEHN